ncbi:hypothetical protein Tco_1578692 [Tanacetum coccineum]
MLPPKNANYYWHASSLEQNILHQLVEFLNSWNRIGGAELIVEYAFNEVSEKRDLAFKALDLVPSVDTTHNVHHVGCEGEYGEKGEDVSFGGDGVDWDDSSMVEGVFVCVFGRCGE